MDRERLKQFIEEAVGRSLRCIPDKEGNPTIGVGVGLLSPRNVQRIDVLGRVAGNLIAGREELTHREVDWLLDGDVELAIQTARTVIANFDELDPARQTVLVDMAFDLGRHNLASFKRLRAALQEQRFGEAAEEIVQSRWYRHAGQRGIRNAVAMHTGRIEKQPSRNSY